uniref:Spindle and centriole-associated protein 1 n=1 Tax=Sphenodon punctatus TaxID=8508 RepID=A0A8D0HHU1_SPHPU
MSRTYAFRGERTSEFLQEDLPGKLPLWPSSPSHVGGDSRLPAPGFQPAILLSPPQQKSSQNYSPLQEETTESAPNWRKSSHASMGAQSINEENCLLTQRWGVSAADKALPSPLRLDGQQGGNAFSTAQRQVLGIPTEGQKKVSQSTDLLGQIAELTLQNSVIKAQLSKFRSCSQGAGDGPQQPIVMQNVKLNPGLATQGLTFPAAPMSLEERIAELNRQSAEAR